MGYKLGKWYEAKGRVRSDFREYWKGILIEGRRAAIIFNYTGARRVHYGDFFDPSAGVIRYVGEGKGGDQKLNARNKRLLEMKGTSDLLHVFLDCGDLFRPKKLLYAGRWHVRNADYRRLDGRRVYVFTLSPDSDEIVEFLKFTFLDTEHKKFEQSLTRFADLRSEMYRDYSEVLRVRDNIIGEIGEYFAVKALNRTERNSVIRLSSGVKNVDAIQIKNGRTYAIKTIGRFPCKTSNIWASKPEETVDDFVVVLIDHERLRPRCVLRMSARKAAKYITDDSYQGSRKLMVNVEFAKGAQLLMGKLPSR